MATTVEEEGIVYPPGVRSLQTEEEISTDDLVRRLKECAQAFQSMAQDEENAAKYEPLAHLLISERFLEHKSPDVRLLVACCIADIFRVSAPDAPYKDEYQIKMLLEFFIDQLKGLSKPNNPAFKRYFYLLENLSVVKTFNICFDIQDCHKIVCCLFKLMFKIINEHQFLKLQRIMADLLCPLIVEADLVPLELMNIIFNHIIEPMKSQYPNAGLLAVEILRKTASSIGTYVQAYFTNEFYLGEPIASERLCNLIYILNTINQGMMSFIIPQLEGKLKSGDENERLMVTKLVARMFSDEKSTMINENQSLWTSFLARSNDVSPNVRVLCVKYAKYFLLRHPESKKEVTEMLSQRSRDMDEDVRYEVIHTIYNAAREDITCIDHEDMKYITERALDKSFRIRKEALLGLAKLYKQYVLDSSYVDPVAGKLLSFVKNKVLYVYYQTTLDDKFLVERIIHTCIVPYQSPTEKRMKLLYQLYCTVDHHAARAFKEILKNQKHMRTLTYGLLEIIQQKRPEKTKFLECKINNISKNLLVPRKSAEYIAKFCKDVENNFKLRSMLSVLMNGDISCSEAANKVREILRFFGNPATSNGYYSCIKQLLERIVPVLLDRESVKYLVMIAKDAVIGDNAIEAELNLTNSAAKGLDLINALANTYHHYFVDEEVFSYFVQILQNDDAEIAKIALETLSFISKDLQNIFPAVYSELLPLLEHFIETGTAKQAKYAIYTIHSMVNDKETVFGKIIETLHSHFDLKSEYYRTALVSVGHIAYLCHDMFATQFKSIVAQTIVKDLIMQDKNEPRREKELWGEYDTLPEETKIKIEGMKVMVRWLSGLKDMIQPAGSTFKLLNVIIQHKGDLMEKKYLGPKEMSWMRLSSANCFLKLCRESKYADCLKVDFFVTLAYVMNDECREVRELFAAKIHKGLFYLRLPLEFLAILALGGLDTRKEFRAQIKKYLVQNISKRKEHCKENSISNDDLPYQWPDYSLPIAVYLFARAPFFTVYNDVPSLLKIKEALQLFIEALIMKKDSYSFSFFKRLLENIKQTKDRIRPDDESSNLKLYAVCDLALNILMSEKNMVWKDFPGQPKLNSKFFTEPDKTYSNLVTYLPPQLLNTNKLVESGFEIELFDKAKGNNASKNISKSSTSKEGPLPSTSKEGIPSTSREGVPSTSREGIPSLSKKRLVAAASTDSKSSKSGSKPKSNTSKHGSDTSPNSVGSSENKQSDTSSHSGTISQKTHITDSIASEIEKQFQGSDFSNSGANSKNGNTNHSDTISNHSEMELDIAASSLDNLEKKAKSQNTLKKKPLPKRAVANRKHTRSSLIQKNNLKETPSFCSEYSKQNGVVPTSPSATSVSSLSPSDYEHLIKPCSVSLNRLDYSASKVTNGNKNDRILFKKTNNDMDSEDYSSNQGSSASSHPSEANPRKRGRPPKNNGKLKQELTLLPSNKRRKYESTSATSVQSSRSSDRTAVSSSPKSSPTKSIVNNGRLPKGKKPPVESKLNTNHTSNSKKINSNAKMREELNAELYEIKNVRMTFDKTTKNKRANGQQNKKNDGKTSGRRR